VTIRTELREDEHLNHGLFFRVLFLGDCMGLGLNPRGSRFGGPNDQHILFTRLVEDDTLWSKAEGETSSAWLPEFIEVARAAQAWLEENAEPDVYENGTFGYRFKEEK
jgi:hypothetical protein